MDLVVFGIDHHFRSRIIPFHVLLLYAPAIPDSFKAFRQTVRSYDARLNRDSRRKADGIQGSRRGVCAPHRSSKEWLNSWDGSIGISHLPFATYAVISHPIIVAKGRPTWLHTITPDFKTISGL